MSSGGEQWELCPTCGGSGVYEDATCPTCGGRGEINIGSGGGGGGGDSGGGDSGGGGGGSYPVTSQRSFLDGVPLSSVKKAKLLTKAGGYLTVARLVYKNVLYDIFKNANHGAVLYSGDYGSFVFVSPEGRIDYGAAASMTIGALLEYLRDVTARNPIPAWDEFFSWFHSVSAQVGQVLASAHSAYMISPNDPERLAQIGIPALDTVEDFATFLDTFSSAMAQGVPDEEGVMPSDLPAGLYQVDERAFAFGALITELKEDGTESAMMALMFVFRE